MPYAAENHLARRRAEKEPSRRGPVLFHAAHDDHIVLLHQGSHNGRMAHLPCRLASLHPLAAGTRGGQTFLDVERGEMARISPFISLADGDLQSLADVFKLN